MDPDFSRALMALQTDLAARETRLVCLFRIQGVEDDTLFRIECADFKHLSGLHESDRQIVIEVDCARTLAGNQGRLKARLGVDERLRILGEHGAVEIDELGIRQDRGEARVVLDPGSARERRLAIDEHDGRLLVGHHRPLRESRRSNRPCATAPGAR